MGMGQRQWMEAWRDHQSLTGVPTRLLMDWRRIAYKCGGMYDITETNGAGSVWVPLEALLAELNTREHVPSKLEAKALRRTAARGGKKDIIVYKRRGTVWDLLPTEDGRLNIKTDPGWTENGDRGLPMTKQGCEKAAKKRGAKAEFVR